MKIALINGSPRKNGATGLILKKIENILKNNESNFKIKLYNLQDIKFKNCLGCEKCYEEGYCVINDGLEDVINEIKECDGIIIGSPNYGSNISAILKSFMDRGHFIVEQSLYNKTCFSLITYEIADGISAMNILNKFFIVSGGKLRNKILIRNDFNINPLKNIKNNKKIINATKKFLQNLIKNKRKPLFQYLLNDIIVVNIIWLNYFKKFSRQFIGVINKYREKNIHSKVTGMNIFNN